MMALRQSSCGDDSESPLHLAIAIAFLCEPVLQAGMNLNLAMAG